MSEPWPLGVLLLALTLGIPGLAIFVLWTPKPRPDAAPDTPDQRAAERLAVALAVPFALFVLVSELLARFGVLEAFTVWLYAGFASGISVAYAIARRDSIVAWRRALDPRAIVLGLGAPAIVLGALVVQLWLVLHRLDSLQAPTPWYYWQQSVAIARAGKIPASAHEWGTTVGFFDYHLGFNALSAAIATATGSVSSLFAAQVLRIVAMVGAVIGIWVLARVWGAPRYAAAASSVAFPCVAILSLKLASYRPEATGYLLLLLTPALLERWFRRGGRVLLLATVISFVGLAEIHTPAATVALVFCAATAVVHFRPSIKWIGAAVGVGLLLVGSWYVADGITGHRGPFAQGFADPPQLTESGRDPTYVFSSLAAGYYPAADPDLLGRDPPTIRNMLDKSLTEGFLVGGDSLYYAFLATIAAIAIAALVLRRWNTVRYFGMAALVVALLLVLAVVSSLGWETFVPRRTGYTRLVQFWWIAPLAGIPLVATLVDRRWFRVVASIALLVLAGVMWVESIDDTKLLDESQPPRATLAALRDLDLEPGALVLTNNYTQDFVQYNTPGIGLLDGRAPYLERDLLARANRIMRATGAYFTSPTEHPFPFAKYNVRYVLVGTAPYALGNLGTFDAVPGPIPDTTGLELLKEGPGFLLYRVTGAGGTAP